MKRLYTLPKMEVIVSCEEDVLTLSYIYDQENKENIVRDPFARAE